MVTQDRGGHYMSCLYSRGLGGLDKQLAIIGGAGDEVARPGERMDEIDGGRARGGGRGRRWS